MALRSQLWGIVVAMLIQVIGLRGAQFCCWIVWYGLDLVTDKRVYTTYRGDRG